MLLAPAPNLAYVIGIPFGLLLAIMLIGSGIWWVLGRSSKG